MARITYGDIVTNITGSIGGVTFQNNRSGAIARLKPKRRATGSSLQSQRLIVTRQLNSIWHTLSLEQQNLWSSFADTYNIIGRSGVEKTVTGYNWFISQNWLSKLNSDTYNAEPPAYVLPSVPSAFTFNVNPDRAEIILESEDTDPDTVFLVYASAVLITSNVNRLKGFRYIKTWSGNPKNTLQIRAEYLATFGIDLCNYSFGAGNKILIYLLPFQSESRIYRAKSQQIFSLPY